MVYDINVLFCFCFFGVNCCCDCVAFQITTVATLVMLAMLTFSDFKNKKVGRFVFERYCKVKNVPLFLKIYRVAFFLSKIAYVFVIIEIVLLNNPENEDFSEDLQTLAMHQISWTLYVYAWNNEISRLIDKINTFVAKWNEITNGNDNELDEKDMDCDLFCQIVKENDDLLVLLKKIDLGTIKWLTVLVITNTLLGCLDLIETIWGGHFVFVSIISLPVPLFIAILLVYFTRLWL